MDASSLPSWAIYALKASIFATTASLTTLLLRARASHLSSTHASAISRLPSLAPWQHVTREDWIFISRVKSLVKSVPAPPHSGFLVAALVSYYDSNFELRSVCGVNSETCVLSSSLCAERCAINQLRLTFSPEGGGHGYRHIKSVYICTSHDMLITPGLLCREYMCEFGLPSSRIFLLTKDYIPAPDELGRAEHVSSVRDAAGQHTVLQLRDLYPYPCMYHTIPRGAVATWAARYASTTVKVEAGALDARRLKCTAGTQLERDLVAAMDADRTDASAPLRVLESRIVALYQAATALAATPHASDSLYPIHYAAGVLLSDGTAAVARQDKALEFGSSLDATCKLASVVLERAAVTAGVVPLVLLHVDNYGVCHAPHANGRSWYVENGFEETVVYLHNADGALVRTRIAELAPAVPRIAL